MYRIVLKAKNNLEGQAQVAKLKKGFRFIQSGWYGGTLYQNDNGEEMIITLNGADDTIEVRKDDDRCADCLRMILTRTN